MSSINDMEEDESKKRIKGIVDVVFLMDATGSMQPCIDNIKDNIRLFFSLMSTADANGEKKVTDWRAKICGYRDYLDNPDNAFENNPFVRDIDSLEAQLSNMKAKGGGDEPESLLDALYTILNEPVATASSEPENPYRWRYKHSCRRVLIIFTDATCHMKIGQNSDVSPENLAQRLTDERIYTFLYAIPFKGYAKLSAEPQFYYYPIRTDKYESAPYSGVYALRDFTSDKENFKEVLTALYKTVSEVVVKDF